MCSHYKKSNTMIILKDQPLSFHVRVKKVKSLSRVRLFATPWTVTYQAPLSMGFSRQEYWSGLPCPPSGDLPNPGIKPRAPMAPTWQAHSLPLSQLGKPCVNRQLVGTCYKAQGAQLGALLGS